MIVFVVVCAQTERTGASRTDAALLADEKLEPHVGVVPPVPQDLQECTKEARVRTHVCAWAKKRQCYSRATRAPAATWACGGAAAKQAAASTAAAAAKCAAAAAAKHAAAAGAKARAKRHPDGVRLACCFAGTKPKTKIKTTHTHNLFFGLFSQTRRILRFRPIAELFDLIQKKKIKIKYN